MQAPHGIPVDLLDRVLIIRTIPYTLEEIAVIVSIRAKTEGLEMSSEASGYLASIGSQTSLRQVYSLNTHSLQICYSTVDAREHSCAYQRSAVY